MTADDLRVCCLVHGLVFDKEMSRVAAPEAWLRIYVVGSKACWVVGITNGESVLTGLQISAGVRHYRNAAYAR